ncbi:sensor histidine kinase [Parabacteroides bouchesdurhonensis]|uniref:sensor histidine kinase n=1 Tax=Parabacteroides bouchesdurhonensis TaxID=1936995 RepID=UPI000E53A675|nr:ATP-binding protein [Parabacteroides bouchesdurhonensis]RHJ95184.1 sensor histidine kinase [Bacteroides sp. AM07-16]
MITSFNKSQLLTDFFNCHPICGALYDGDGALIDINQAMKERYKITDEHSFFFNHLFNNDLLIRSQKHNLLAGKTVKILLDQVNVIIIPHKGLNGDCAGYNLFINDINSINSSQENSYQDMAKLVAKAVPDTILLINKDFIIEKIVTQASHFLNESILNKRIDKIQGYVGINISQEEFFQTVQDCLHKNKSTSIQISLQSKNDNSIKYFKVRIVPAYHQFLVLYIRNITDIVEKEKENKKLSGKLIENRSLMELALQNSRTTIYSFNHELFQTCDKVNCNHCLQFYGTDNHILAKNQYICKNLQSLQHSEDQAGFFSLFNKIRNEKLSEYTTNFRLKNNNGKYHNYEVAGKVLTVDKEGRANVIIGSLIDNQKHMEYEESLIKAKEEAETADQLKSVFLANMTHDIRTPLHAIIGFSDLLSEETDPELRQNYINIIKTNNELLVNLINDVLDISKIESNLLTFDYTDIFLSTFMQDIYQTVRLKTNENVELILDQCPNQKLNVDKNRLSQILINLLTNAIKHTFEGSIHFGYQLEEEYVRFYVTDTGEGISDANIDKIFTRFVQIKGHKTGGVGLGLAICKGLVNKMGGDISVTSKEGCGSTFNFTIPYTKPDNVL